MRSFAQLCARGAALLALASFAFASPVAAAKESRYASAQSGWRTITCPSESSVCFQLRRGVPGRSSFSSTAHWPASRSQAPRPSMRVTRPRPCARLKTMPQLYLRAVEASKLFQQTARAHSRNRSMSPV